MKAQHLIICISLLVAISCSDNKDKQILTFQLARAKYHESINVPGSVQAVLNTPVASPNGMFGSLTVMKLARDGEFVHKGDTICILSSAELQSVYKAELTSVENLEAEEKKAEADNNLNIALLEASLLTSEAQMKISSLDSLQLQYASDLKKKLLALEMQKATIEKQKSEKKLASARKIAENDLRQKKARIMQEKMKAKMYEDQLNALYIIAQRDGTVQRVESPMMMISSSQGTGVFGGEIKEGSVLPMPGPVLQFPDLSKMQISADAAEADFKKIEKNQRVVINVDAANKLVTTGKIVRKSLATSSSQRYSRSKVRTYEVIISIDSLDSVLKPGLSANCEIFLKETKDTLFVPTVAIFDKDSSKVVYVLDKNRYSPVKVTTGTSGSYFTIITGGLSGNETIALAQPPNSMISKERKKEKNELIRNEPNK